MARKATTCGCSTLEAVAALAFPFLAVRRPHIGGRESWLLRNASTSGGRPRRSICPKSARCRRSRARALGRAPLRPLRRALRQGSRGGPYGLPVGISRRRAGAALLGRARRARPGARAHARGLQPAILPHGARTRRARGTRRRAHDRAGGVRAAQRHGRRRGRRRPGPLHLLITNKVVVLPRKW